MIYKYERACQEAGLEESRIAEIRRFFDAEKKRLSRDKEARDKAGIVFNSLSSLVQPEGSSSSDEYEIADDRANVEEQILHKLELDHLHECLAGLPEDDREFLFALFSGGYGNESRMAKEMGIPRTTLIRRKERLLKQLREKFFEKS